MSTSGTFGGASGTGASPISLSNSSRGLKGKGWDSPMSCTSDEFPERWAVFVAHFETINAARDALGGASKPAKQTIINWQNQANEPGVRIFLRAISRYPDWIPYLTGETECAPSSGGR